MTENQWDHIVVGAGSAGCVVAARLAEAGRSVLVLEAGGSEHATPWLTVPIGVGKILQDERYAWKFHTEPEAGAGGRRMYWPRGKVVGGSSGINGMIWVVGDPDRYDAWAEQAGALGWAWKDIEPMLRRAESYSGGGVSRGNEGPVRVEDLGAKDGLTAAFIKACEAVGIPKTSDYNAPPYEGVSRLQMSTRRGLRCSAAAAYLRPAMRKHRIELRSGALVRRVVFDGRRATGIEYSIAGGEAPITVAARHGVVIAAGAIQSPQLLELSGVGQSAHLKALGIPVVHELKGVGENLSDHYHVRVTYRAKGILTFNEIQRRPWLHGPKAALELLAFGTGPMSYISATAHALARTSPDLSRPDIKIQMHLVSMSDRSDYRKGVGVDPFPGASIGFFQMYPESRGSVHITARDPAAAPRIVANYLAAERDRAIAVRGLRMAREIAAQASMRPYIVAETRPGDGIDGDDGLLEYARMNGQTSYHPVGTCRMGIGPLAVVDADCKVHGLDGLRVIDASIMPHIVASNTNAPAIAIGEKGAECILRERNR